MHFRAHGFMLGVMNELDEVWVRRLNEARAAAQAQGRGDVAEYLALKAANDTLRQTSVQWLLDCLTEIAAFENRNGAGITIENQNPHYFDYGNATLVGSLLSLRQGVRCLSLEAGWTRTPADGFMRGGALAAARLSHFGRSRHNAELVLISEKNVPNWFAVDKDGKRGLFDSKNLNQHFQVFLDTI